MVFVLNSQRCKQSKISQLIQIKIKQQPHGKNKSKVVQSECVKGENEFSKRKKKLIIPDIEIEQCDSIKRGEKK